jgi:hypothetical protein
MLYKIIAVCYLFFTVQIAGAQYYYKDIIGTRETAEIIKHYNANKVSKVVLNSYDAENTKNGDFYVEQLFDPISQVLRTVTRSGVSDASVLISFTDQSGHVVKTIDSSGAITSNTVYQYNPDGVLLTVNTVSSDTSSASQTEDHIWQYEQNKIKGMLRIKNKVDTTVVTFKYDESGNISEESSIRKGVPFEPVYYYYDSNHRLTDIVRFNKRARRLLPEYMFEYSSANQVIQKITVPANGSDYLIWRYQYNNNGLKTKEAIYNKQKQLTGKIEYQYVFTNN